MDYSNFYEIILPNNEDQVYTCFQDDVETEYNIIGE